ncbi:S-layer homology domain-containing protein [Bacillus sp. E(2018)]|uniref:S-layer homology domain-containing protein n=1 Tax=Bacillus sp. E(2018) TaxID=2502239 RepID=UPI0010F87BA1|nr:S-layer homology domain-containing protein [Bacillus sp. E(2018)]
MASKSYRKFMATGLSAAVVASVVAPVAGAAAYDDVKEGAWYEEAINYVTEMEYMQGTGKGFEPGADMTRAQAAQLFANILGLDGKGLKADFSDVKEGAWYYEAIAAVKEHGVMSGSGAKFNPNATLTRGEMAAIIVRAYDLKDHEGRDHSFTDIEDNMFKTEIAILADLGIVDGVSAGKFAPKAEVTRAQMASFIFKTEVPEVGFPEVTAVKAVDTKTVEVTVEGAWTQEDVDALVEAGYELTVEGKASHKVGKVTVKAAEASTSADTTTLVLSEIAPELVAGEELSLAVDGEKVEGSEFKYEAPATPEVKSVSAIGVKKLEVNFNKEVDTTKAQITVKKGSIAVNTANVTFSADKKSAVIELTSKLSKGDYTVSVAGLTDSALTKVVSVEDEKVAKIEVLSAQSPLVDASAAIEGGGDDALVDDMTVGYQVLNQYGENITSSVDLQATSNATSINVDKANGKLTFVGNFDAAVNKTATVTLIHVPTATTATAVVTAAAEAKVSDVAISGVYNKDGKVLTETSNLTNDAFYLVVDAKDQYGNTITNESKLESELLLNQSNGNVVTVNNTTGVPNFEASTMEINGSKKTVIKLNGPVTAGENLVTLIAKSTGKSSTSKVTVAEAVRADVIKLQTPDITVAGEKAYIPVEVLDKSGNAITDVSILNGARGVDLTVGTTLLTNPFKVVNGNVVAEVPSAQVSAPGYVSVVAVSKTTQKVATLTLDVKTAAAPAVVVGLHSDFSKTLRGTSTATVGVSDLVIQDQYGRTMTTAAVNAWLTGGKKIVITEDETAGSALSISDAAGDNNIAAAGETVTLTAGAVKGAERISIALNNGTADIAGSEASATLRVTDDTEYASYVVEEIGTVYDELSVVGAVDAAAYDKAIEVYGVLNDGSKVLLTAGTDFTVKSSNANLQTDAADGKIDAAGWDHDSAAGTPVVSYVSYATDATEKEHTVTVTINATGQEIVKTVKFSKVAPKVESVKFVNNNSTTASAIDSVTFAGLATDAFDIADLTAGASATNILATDQYGVKVVATGTTGGVLFADGTTVAAPTLTFSPAKGAFTITGNGLASGSLVGIDANEEFSVKVTYAGGANASLKVVK